MDEKKEPTESDRLKALEEKVAKLEAKKDCVVTVPVPYPVPYYPFWTHIPYCWPSQPYWSHPQYPTYGYQTSGNFTISCQSTQAGDALCASNQQLGSGNSIGGNYTITGSYP
jgi:hypothetical protein